MEISRIVCMQCGRVIRDFGRTGGTPSHGLCPECAEQFARDIEALMPAPESSVVRLGPLALAVR